ncbi:MAG: phosphoadenosine phosphosulfate reductase family protein [Parvularculaceae bacterium]
MPVVEHDGDHFKINPLAAWERGDVADYLAAHKLPEHPLVRQGYFSIGCMPCTSKVADEADARSGRWAGQAKTECGIHMPKKRP